MTYSFMGPMLVSLHGEPGRDTRGLPTEVAYGLEHSWTLYLASRASAGLESLRIYAQLREQTGGLLGSVSDFFGRSLSRSRLGKILLDHPCARLPYFYIAYTQKVDVYEYFKF
jgi:hypothetical protein